ALEGFSGGRGQVMTFIHRDSYAGPGAMVSALPIEGSGTAASNGTTPSTVSVVGPAIVPSAANGVRGPISDLRGSSPAPEMLRVAEAGNVYAKGAFRPSSPNLAEYQTISEPVEAGDVLVADRDVPGSLRKGSSASDPAVVGIVSSDSGILLGSDLDRIAAS